MNGRVREVTGAYALFGREEFAARWQRARQMMADARLDALLVTSEANCIYLSGHETPGWVIKSRPHIFLLPLAAEPVLLTGLTPEARAFSAVSDVRSYAAAGFESAACALLEDIVRALKLNRARIGCEFGIEQRLGLSHLQWQRLTAALSEVGWVDAAPQLWRLRMIKSPAELDYMRRAARANAAGLAAVRRAIGVGVTERELSAVLMSALARAGADRNGYVAMHSGAGNYGRASSWPVDRILQPGDLLYLDSGCRCRGYWSDYNRTFCLGEPREEQLALYRAAYRSMQAALAQVRPGMAVSALWQAAEAIIAESGFRTSRTTRDGHGVGLDLTEPPSVLPDEDLVLESGMVLAIEPRIDTSEGHFQTEENIVVTEDGYELLSERQSPELQVV